MVNMARRPESLQASDVAVALRLALSGGDTYDRLADALGIAKSSAHRSVQRLEKAGLAVPERRQIVRPALRELLAGGIRYVFYAEPGAEVPGIPTAHSAPPLSDELDFDRYYVWPSADGVVRGASVQPLLRSAPKLHQSEPELYRALALVDAVRVGRARERNRAVELLDDLLVRGDD